MLSKEDFRVQLGRRLRELRNEKGISTRELEIRGDIDRHAISKIENGVITPTTYTLYYLCQILEVKMEEVFIFGDSELPSN